MVIVKDKEKMEISDAVGRSVKWYNQFGKCLVSFFKQSINTSYFQKPHFQIWNMLEIVIRHGQEYLQEHFCNNTKYETAILLTSEQK